MITLHKLKLFMVVYDRGSFNMAAQELYMAQSAVSQHIQTLESALGTPLFERSTRGVRPTRAGEILYDYAGRMLRLLSEAERSIMQAGGAPGKPLAVSATPGLSVYLLPPWLQRFQQTHPQFTVALQTALTHEVVRDVLNGRYDLGFVEGELNELDQNSLGKMRFSELEYFVMVGARHEWAGRESVTVHDLHGQPYINRLPNSRARLWLENILSARDVRLRTTAELDSPGAIKYALLNQMGISVLPHYAVEREVERGEIHQLRLEGLELKRPLLLIWDKREVFSTLQRAFIGLLAEDAPPLQILL